MTHAQAVDTLATERYILDEMSPADRDAFEEHFFTCDTCADDLRVAAAMIGGAKAGFASRGPKESRRGVWYRSHALPWAAAAALLVVTTYQSFWIVGSLRRDASSFAIRPVTLRPASRGAAAVVLLPKTGPASLAIEVNETAASGEISYVLRNAGGDEVTTGRAPAPEAGAPLLLLIPSKTLVGSTQYVLSIHDAGPSNRLLGEYRFTVSQE